MIIGHQQEEKGDNMIILPPVVYFYVDGKDMLLKVVAIFVIVDVLLIRFCEWGLLGIRCFLTALGFVNNACRVTEGQMQG